MQKNAYLLAKIGADTAENERKFAKNWQLSYGSTALGTSQHACAMLLKSNAREFGSQDSQPMLGLTQRSNYLTYKGSFSAVSKPNFASKYAFESSRRDLHNALLCTALKSHFSKHLLEICQRNKCYSQQSNCRVTF